MQARLVAGGLAGLVTVLVLWTWLPAGDEAPQRAAGQALAWTGASSAGTHMPSDAPGPAAAPAKQAEAWTPPQAAGAALAAPITVAAVQKLRVGEMSDLVIGLGANAGVGEISFTVQFDANVLQVRAASEGGWAADAGANTRFGAEISGAEDRVQIRSAVSGRRLGGAGGSVALVQFQAVAPGTTSVMISDVAVKDRAGHAMPFVLASSNLQLTAESVPPPLPAPARSRSIASTEAPAAETFEAGD